MDSNTVEKYKKLSEQKTRLEHRKIELNVQLDSTRKEYKTLLDNLKETYNVNSLDEAKTLLASMESELEQGLTRLSEQLNVFENKLSGV